MSYDGQTEEKEFDILDLYEEVDILLNFDSEWLEKLKGIKQWQERA